MYQLWEKYGHQIHKCQVLISGVRESLKIDSFERSTRYLDLIFTDLVQALHPSAIVAFAEWHVEAQVPHRHQVETVKLHISLSRLSVYIHDSLLKAGQAETILHRLAAVIFLVALGIRQSKNPQLSVLCELSDVAELPSIGFSSNRDDTILIPDPDFVFSAGYAPFRAFVAQNFVPWAARKRMVIWRGSTTGIQQHPCGPAGKFSWLQRLEMCDKLQAGPHAAVCDVGISNIVQIHDENLVREIIQAGFIRPRVEKQAFLDFKYSIDVDGNSNAWSGLFEALLLGCCILKVTSFNNYKQWYYDRLIPWTHFVPVRADLTDINNVLNWCLENDAACEGISIRSRELAASLTYDAEMEAAARKLSQLMQGDSEQYKVAAEDPLQFLE
jgi:hypothetical protein